MKSLISEYSRKKDEIRERLGKFRNLGKADEKDIFAELCFCILTPQSKAWSCDLAVKELRRSDLLFKGDVHSVKTKLKGVRFPNNKANYLVAARKFFRNGRGLDIKSKLDKSDSFGMRDWLVKNVKGLGYKEAGHFLRNIGRGERLAILDRHILKNLKDCGVIKKIPKGMSRKQYLSIEDKMRSFSKKSKISMEELDLLFWSRETGEIFK